MGKEKKEQEIKLDETNIDLSKPLEEQEGNKEELEDKSKETNDKENEKEITNSNDENDDDSNDDEKTKEKEELEKDKEQEVIDLDNKPINDNVIKESEEVPVGFIPPIPKKEEVKETFKIKNGRVYKELKNGSGIYADNGEVFKI